MKIQKRFIRKYKEKDYYKYIITIPKYILEESGLNDGDIMDIKAEKNKIILIKE